MMMIQGTFGVIQETFGVIQGTFGVIQGTFGGGSISSLIGCAFSLPGLLAEEDASISSLIQGTFGVIQGTFGVIQGTFRVIQRAFGAASKLSMIGCAFSLAASMSAVQ
jgi:hypothetical protein